jgi:PKD repeat protein
MSNPAHTYTADGSYTVSLTVVGPGGSDTKTRANYIAVGHVPGPNVAFTADVTSGEAPLEVKFTDQSTGNNVHAWSWDFGDGGSSSSQNPAHIYNTAGTYHVTLTATDDDGTKAHTEIDYITVTGGSAGTGVDPSGGTGGAISPGTKGTWSCSAGNVYVYIPTSYNPSVLASPVVYLFNEEISQWSSIADANGIILVDLDEYNDVKAYIDKINFVLPKIAAEYNVDKARYYFAGWSAGGNIVIAITDTYQGLVAAAMVFPGGHTDYGPAMPPERPAGAKYYYAVGENDTSTGYYPGCVGEANARQSQGYTTRCDVVGGCGHRIDEDTYHKRQDAWNWVKGFNLQN